MKTQINLHICKSSGSDNTLFSLNPCLDGDDYIYVDQLIRKERLHPRPPTGALGSRATLAIFCDITHPALLEIFQVLRRNGYRPYPSRFLPPDAAQKVYPILHIRTWESMELDAMPVLRFLGWDSGPNTLIVVLAYEGYSPIAAVDYVTGEIGASWDVAYGSVSGDSYYVVSSKTKEVMEHELNGCRFLPVKWDDPLRAKADFWVLDASFILPPCLTPRVLYRTSWYWDDGGGVPEVLEFARQAVQAMGPFDIARTQEIMGDTTEGKPECRGPHFIVSQKFREVINRIANDPERPAKFCPVKLRA